MGTVSHADCFGRQLETLVMERFASAAEDKLRARASASCPERRCPGDDDAEAPLGAYSAALQELAALATTRLQGLCVHLLAWHIRAQELAKELPVIAPAFLADELLAEGLEAAMPAYAGANLDSEYADKIENILIELIKSAPTEPAQGEEPCGAAVAVLEALSSCRLLVIVGKVQAAAKLVPAADKTAALQLVQLLGKLQLVLGSSTQMAQSAQTLRIISELSKDKSLKCYSPEVKHAALDAAARLLLNTSAQREPAVNYAPWDQVLSEVWEETLALRSKSKHALPALALLASLVTVLPATEVDGKAAILLRDHIYVALAPVKSGGIASKMLSAAGIGSTKNSDDIRLVALQALHSIMQTLQHTSLHLREQSSKLMCQLVPIVHTSCEALGANRDSRNTRDTAATLTAIANLLCLPAVPTHLDGWPAWRQSSSTRAALYLSPDSRDVGGWRWSLSLIQSMLLASPQTNGGGGGVEASVAALMALQRIVSSLSLEGGRVTSDSVEARMLLQVPLLSLLNRCLIFAHEHAYDSL